MSVSPPPPRTGQTKSRGPVLIVLSGLALTVQLYGLYRPIGPLEPTWFPQADKVGHVLVFAIPVALILLTLTWYAARRSATV